MQAFEQQNGSIEACIKDCGKNLKELTIRNSTIFFKKIAPIS